MSEAAAAPNAMAASHGQTTWKMWTAPIARGFRFEEEGAKPPPLRTPTGTAGYGLVGAAGVAAVSVVATDENIDWSEPPTLVSAATAATDTSAAIRPYSMAVAPARFLKTLRMTLNMVWVPYLKVDDRM